MTGIHLVDLSGEPIDYPFIYWQAGATLYDRRGNSKYLWGYSCVDIKRISSLGLPWGALVTQYLLESFIKSDVKSWWKCKLADKYQLKQTYGVSIRAIMNCAHIIKSYRLDVYSVLQQLWQSSVEYADTCGGRRPDIYRIHYGTGR